VWCAEEQELSRDGKDSAEVVKFMKLFARLKEWSDDQPHGLAELTATDASVEGLCIELGLAPTFYR